MDSKRLALYALVGVSLLALLAQPVAAAYDSTAEALIRDLNQKLLYVAIPITVLVEVILFYAVWRFRDNDDPKPTEENRRLEITWTVATALILVFVGFASYGVMAELIVSPDQSDPAMEGDRPGVEVTAIGQKWFWTFEYPNENISTSGTVVIPANRTIYLDTTARDWIHAVHVPALGLKQDAIPGQTHTLRFTATTPGEYQLYCAEYCGTGHSEMLATVRVVSQDEYQQWLSEQGGGEDGDGGNETSGNGTDGDNESSIVGSSAPSTDPLQTVAS